MVLILKEERVYPLSVMLGAPRRRSYDMLTNFVCVFWAA